MAFKLFFSLTALSLVCGSIYAEEDSPDSSQEPLKETQEETSPKKSRRLAFAAAKEKSEEKSTLPRRMKPHFAGARRSDETAKPQPARKSRKVKNEWFSSKTQPKNDKKEAPRLEAEAPESPNERPYFVKTSHSWDSPIATSHRSGISQESNPQPEQSEGHEYPRTGFKAPSGHVYFTGEWLFWRTRQEGMEFATSTELEFDFQSGFRVGAGAHLPSFDGWCIYANYTRFLPEATHHTHHSAYPLFLFQGAGVGGNAVTDSWGKWKIKYQSADLEFGKAYYLTKTLIFSPFFGLKGAWIDQHARFHYNGGYIPIGQTFHTHFKNDFKGAGPLLGTEMNWQLGAGFSFFGKGSAALIAGHFDVSQKQYQLNGAEVVRLENDFNLVSPFLQLGAGLGWDYNFHQDQCHFGLTLGFEAQQWWNQNQTEQFTDEIRPAYVRQRGDLSFYGLTLGARLDF